MRSHHLSVMSDENCFTGRDYVNDVVPRKFHRTDAGDKALPVRNNVPGALHKVAQYAPGQGPAKLTHALYGLDGISLTPITLGAGRRVPVDWKAGDGFQETVMWTPEEAMKAKAFSDSHAELVKRHCPGDDFMYECAGQCIAFLTVRVGD